MDSLSRLHEAIFKVVRHQGTKDDGALHYFSHYEASKAYAADGELRVGGITEREITEKAIQSRDQVLKFFINALQTIFITISNAFQAILAGLLANFTWLCLKSRIMRRLMGQTAFLPSSHYQTLTLLEGFGFNREVLSVAAFAAASARVAQHIDNKQPS